jgi:hypothetical protein
MRDSFYFCYNKLCRNINRIIRIIPDVVTTRMFYEYLSLLEDIKNIEDRSFMFLPFREALYKLFKIVLDILIKCSPLYLRASYYYKYLYRLNDLTESIDPVSLDFVVKLTCDLNDEVKNRVRNLTRNSVEAEPINYGEVVGNVSLNNIGKIPHAVEYTGEETTGRNVNPINYNGPSANAVLVETQSSVGNVRSRRRPPILPARRTSQRPISRLGNNAVSLNEPDNTANRVGSTQSRRPARRPPRRLARRTRSILQRPISIQGNNAVSISLNDPRLGNNNQNTLLNEPITTLIPTRFSIRELRNRISRRRPGSRF